MSTPAPLSGPQLLERFRALDAFLLAHQQFWRPKPFTERQLPWESQNSELALWLRQRSLADAEAAHNQPHLLDAPAPFAELAARSAALSALGELPRIAWLRPSARLSVDVPGRKWEQIQAFAERLQFARQPDHWLDWCAGKGHLGRLLAQGGAALTCLERDIELVDAGQQLSARSGLRADHACQDVMADGVAVRLRAEHTPVALHACGDLHVRLLQLASAAGCAQLAVAPCCYNRIAVPQYRPLSSVGQASALRLSREELGLPQSETVTAGARVRRQRDSSMARRLAFDLLQRQLRDCDEYLPTPSLPTAWLHKDFSDYCRDLALLKGLSAPAIQDWGSLEAAGWQRLAEVRNLELVRGLFRRPLELWLLLDRALYIEERGYQVRLGTFCTSQLTPRNVLLLAEKVTHKSCG